MKQIMRKEFYKGEIMLQDIMNHKKNFKLDGKTYTLEFDHNAYANVESKTSKSIYEIYNNLLVGKYLTMVDFFEIIVAGLRKNHTDFEIDEFVKYSQNNIWVYNDVLPILFSAYIIPLSPPQSMSKFVDTKKKVPRQKKVTQNIIG